MKNKLKYFMPVLTWFCIINYLLFFFKPGGGGNNIPHADKMIHATLFAILTSLGVFAGIKYFNLKRELKNYIKFFIIFCLAFAALSELIQAFVIPLRTGDMYDLLADTIGVFMGYYLFKKIVNKMPIRLKKLFLKL